MKDEIINILNNLNKHIIYDKNIQSICYSASLINAKNNIIKILNGGDSYGNAK